jgi:hypothetical protein
MDVDEPDFDTTIIWQVERCHPVRDCSQMTTTEYLTGDVWVTETITTINVKTRTTTQPFCMYK